MPKGAAPKWKTPPHALRKDYEVMRLTPHVGTVGASVYRRKAKDLDGQPVPLGERWVWEAWVTGARKEQGKTRTPEEAKWLALKALYGLLSQLRREVEELMILAALDVVPEEDVEV